MVGKGGGESRALTHLDSCPCSDRLSLWSSLVIILYTTILVVFTKLKVKITQPFRFVVTKLVQVINNTSQCSQQLNLFFFYFL